MINPFIDENGNDIFPYQPLKSIVFILVCPESEVINGIVIPEQYRREHSDEYGVVLGIGKGCYIKKFKKYIPTTVKVGDVVAYNSGIPYEMMIKDRNGIEHLVKYCAEFDIQGYFPKKVGV